MRLLLVCLMLLAAPAAAQGVYVTDEALATPDTGDTRYAMDDAAPAADPSFKAYIATGFGVLTYTTAFEYTVESGFTAVGDLTWTAYVSCDQPTFFRPGVPNSANDVQTYRAELLRGTTIITSHAKYEERTCDGPSDVWQAVFTFEAAGQAWAPGELLRVNNIIWTANAPAGRPVHNVHILGGVAHPSGLTGPGLPGGVLEGPVVVYANLTDGFRHTYEAPHDGRYVFTWNSTGAANMTLLANLTAGLATVAVRDANGTELYNATWEANGTSTEVLEGAAGDWTFDVAYTGFTGTLELGVAAPSPPGNGTASPDDTPTDGATVSQEATTSSSPAAEKSPAGLVLPALAAGLLLRRR